MNLRYLITGTGRCGTVFMARLLTSVGIPCGHEVVFDWRGLDWARKVMANEVSSELSWASRMSVKNGKPEPEEQWLENTSQIEADSSYMAAPFLLEDDLQATSVIHIVRDPVKVVNSWCNHIDYFKSESPSNRYERFIYKYLPEMQEDIPLFDRACLYYIRWNKMIERRKPDFFYRVEDPVEDFLSFIGASGPHFSDTTINTYKKSPQIPFMPHRIQSKTIRDEFMDLGRSYGYKIASEPMMI